LTHADDLKASDHGEEGAHATVEEGKSRPKEEGGKEREGFFRKRS
jgi:hypothetical protein